MEPKEKWQFSHTQTHTHNSQIGNTHTLKNVHGVTHTARWKQNTHTHTQTRSCLRCLTHTHQPNWQHTHTTHSRMSMVSHKHTNTPNWQHTSTQTNSKLSTLPQLVGAQQGWNQTGNGSLATHKHTQQPNWQHTHTTHSRMSTMSKLVHSQHTHAHFFTYITHTQYCLT
jgi:hypothetical protein